MARSLMRGVRVDSTRTRTKVVQLKNEYHCMANNATSNSSKGRARDRATMLTQFQNQQRRSIQTYFPPARPKPYRWMILGGIGLVALSVLYKWYYRHNYPAEVAAKLRKALKAELKTENPDYKVALQFYLEALEEADALQMDPVSDEYTGLQVKIAEMYEKLGMDEDARLLYRELGTAYVQALAGRGIPASLRPHIIQRQLRVALKTAMFESKTNPNFAKMGLLVHFLIAQKEIVARDPSLKDIIEGDPKLGPEANQERRAINVTELLQEDMQRMKNEEQEGKKGGFFSSLTSSFSSSSSSSSAAPSTSHSEAWEPFRDELFSARDMFVALCIATGDIGVALKTKLTTTEWMAVAGCDIGEILMSFYNVASIFYLQSEELELMHERALQMQNQAAEGNKLDNAAKPSAPIAISAPVPTPGQGQGQGQVQGQGTPIKPLVMPQLHNPHHTHEELAQEAINNAKTCYEVILKVVDDLPGHARRDTRVAEAHALSIYGLGVIALHKSQLDKAQELLRESRLRAKGCGFEDLVVNSELELKKLDKLQKELEAGHSVEFEGPSIDVLFLKHMPAPANAGDSKDSSE